MPMELSDLSAFIAVMEARGFREAARRQRVSASALSDAIRRLETAFNARLLHRTTRSVAPTDAGAALYDKLRPALQDIQNALDSVNDFRAKPVGALKLNAPMSAARLVLPTILPGFLAAYPDITVDVIVEESFVDIIAAGCDAGIRYEERLEQDVIAVPIGPKIQRYATAASPAYLAKYGRPAHPKDLLRHACLRGRFASGNMPAWEFEKDGEILMVEPAGRLVVQLGGGADLAVSAAIAGSGVIQLFEQWLEPSFRCGELQPILTDWQTSFSGPFLYYSGRRHVPAPLRAFIDFIKANGYSPSS